MAMDRDGNERDESSLTASYTINGRLEAAACAEWSDDDERFDSRAFLIPH
jgi:hypothetical protein